mmetsp:Transcript_22832/g.54593  ORF Transcript_22832/g.54593 Transcript_22832/m.54593 type:complete len:200 (+) Transcript_22832:1012-1611(+)
MVAKLSSASTILAASLETSVPVIPIATPMFAALRAGASLTPSPVMDTVWPRRWSDLTMRILFSGDARANTLHSSTIESMPSSSMASSSGPVYVRIEDSCSLGSTIPSILAMAVAVAGWSPVIIFTTIPAICATATPSIASGRGGSRIATTPIIVRNGVGALRRRSASMLSERSLGSKSARQMARQRSPRPDICEALSCQ